MILLKWFAKTQLINGTHMDATMRGYSYCQVNTGHWGMIGAPVQRCGISSFCEAQLVPCR